MNIKEKRQNKIVELIKSRSIPTQQLLQELLSAAGFETTQATVSRDIRELKLIKIADGDGYCYALPEIQPKSGVVNDMLCGAVTGIDYAVNTVVVKCRNGTANAACVVLESMNYGEVVGTIAGDDTIFVLMRSEKAAKAFCDALARDITRNTRRE